MRVLLPSLAVWAGLFGVSGAHAQTQELNASAAMACLTPAEGSRGQPEYPAQLRENRDGGKVEVELTFTRPDQGPAVQVLDEQRVPRRLEESVREHVANFRVPCLKPGMPPVKLRQSFNFDWRDTRPVMPSMLVDLADSGRREKLACLVHSKGQKLPDVSLAARRAGLDGKVMIELRFTAPDAKPEVKVLAASRNEDLWLDVVEYARELRLPCLDSEPVSFWQLYLFKIDGNGRTLLRDMPLQTWSEKLRAGSKPARFDLDSMGCPFDLRLTYYAPHRRNVVRELDTHNPARLPLLYWLASTELKLWEPVNTSLLGETATLQVPCGTFEF